ncbi:MULTISPECIES: 5-formyltetrahydrofolate cyclo-ligase [unclassified Sphingomonas]|uniref:5-formyltetrahydrofolate cyclo-ligase n=1 Tax=unclassified Sphingomonas TaxID=196159 RepID=UPI000BCE0C7D|nr:MAG: 5-formyltetrahydrofolate cyclo-ligase [Sphingomonas sp. 32-62-10]OYY64133.1 MAG: 5-formyltetrahydrofolate cyclo-ligase [Sphingomonas sp. 28-62-11]
MSHRLKAELRDDMRRKRLAYAKVGPPIIPPHDYLDRLTGRGTIAGYIAMPGEADPNILMIAARNRGWTVALPHITSRANPMRFLTWHEGDLLVAGPMGVRQPDADAEPVEPDIVLTPLLVFDRALNRLGQGAGYYDRAFADLPAVLRIGIAWSIQRVDALPVDPWDVPLHGVIDEYGWNRPEQNL